MLHIIYEFAYDVSVFRIQMTKKWYVVYKGKVPGVYEHWEDCLKQVNGFEGNSYKGYKTKKEAEAQWRRSNGMRTGYIVIPLLLIVTAFLLYVIVV